MLFVTSMAAGPDNQGIVALSYTRCGGQLLQAAAHVPDNT